MNVVKTKEEEIGCFYAIDHNDYNDYNLEPKYIE